MGGGTARQIANAHTIFNLANTVVFLGFTSHLARWVTRLLPDRPPAEERTIRAKYLDSELVRTPALALDRARLHVGAHRRHRDPPGRHSRHHQAGYRRSRPLP